MAIDYIIFKIDTNFDCTKREPSDTIITLNIKLVLLIFFMSTDKVYYV